MVGIYTVYFTSVVLVRLRSLLAAQDEDSLWRSLTLLKNRSAHLRDMMTALLYFFGFAFFIQIQGSFWTPDNNRPVGLMVLENFLACFRFAAFVFLIFLALHLVQWFVSARIGRATLRLRARDVT